VWDCRINGAVRSAWSCVLGKVRGLGSGAKSGKPASAGGEYGNQGSDCRGQK